MAAEARVLVAEENPVLAGTLSWLLREQGYNVTSVANRGALFATLSRATPDVILLDVDTAAGGAAALSELRGDQRWNDVRVIVTAPWAGLDDRPAVLPWGADDCVSKPFRVAELLGRLRTQLRASGQLRAARFALQDTASELERAREDAVSNRRLVDILHEVTGELSASEVYRILARRVGNALDLTRCSVVLARPGETVGTMVAASDDSTITDFELRLDRYPEIGTALDAERPVLIEDARVHPLLASARTIWEREGRMPELRSVAVIPFSVDRWRSGVLVLRTGRGERRLTSEDVGFAEVVVRAAVAAIRRGQALETTRADNRRLEALATTDPLTRLLNRRALTDRLAAELDRARRFDSSLSLLLVDVDHFKQINDTIGHLAGDAVLREMGALLEEAVRTVDIVARYGGEEFVVLLPETATDGGTVFAERLRERIAARAFDVGTEHPLRLTASVGIASFPSPEIKSTDDLFARADEALYRAKAAGRNLVCT
jgi:two-component system, cell cycle response regulator